jgi:HKD family nuclease
MIELLLNEDNRSVRDFILGRLRNIDTLNCAVAYFADSAIVDICLKKKIKVKLLVSLTPPTNPYILKKLLPHPTSKIEMKFFTRAFHSKLTMFAKSNKIKCAIIGSSNYTNGGLEKNIETNVFLENESTLKEIAIHFDEIWQKCPYLEPEDLKRYIPIYKKALQSRNKIDSVIDSFEKKSLVPRIGNKPYIPRKEGRIYYEFWKCIDEVKDLILNKVKLPNQPTYLLIDNFWQWVKVIWDKKESSRMKKDSYYKHKMIPVLFQRFLAYDKANDNWTLGLKSRAIFFQKLLGPKKIMSLTRKQAREVYNQMNSGRMRTQRFGADLSFVSDNDIKKIRTSLNYLLWDKADVAERITRLIYDDSFKLAHFGKNNIQELIGWVHEDMPPRNEKANSAIELIGYKFR